jgi:hypothetical protein
MKKTIAPIPLILIAALLSFSTWFTGCGSSKPAASSANNEAIVQAVQNDQWVFTPSYAMPQGSRSRNITGSYFVTCTKDKIVFSLPYFGKLYSPSGAINSQSPLDFTSNKFSLQKDKNKKGAGVITVKPEDNNEVQSAIFTFFDNGSATLNVTFTNRSPISFNGTVAPKQ